jgi:protein-disulfide isomerase
MKRALPFVIIAAVLVVALLAAWILTRPSPSPVTTHVASSPSPAAKVTTASPASSTPAADDSAGAQPPHAKGDPNATVVIEEYGDFQCPPCSLFHPILTDMEREFGPRLRIIFREFPLAATHKHALEAARAAEAAGLQGKFWEMHHKLYESQTSWAELPDASAIFEDHARKIGLNVEQWKRDMKSDAVEQRIFLDGKRAHRLGVKGTPTVFLNGREVPFQSLAPDLLRPLIQAEFDRAR